SAALASFKRYRLNIWGTVADPLFEAAAWDACYEPYMAEDLAGELCFGGLDVSKTEDMTAFALMFPMGGGEYRQLCWFWLPQEAYEKNRDRVEYDEWRRQGWLEICPGARIDESIVEEKIRWADEQFALESVHYDPYRASGIVRGLEDSGIQCVEFPQTLMRFAEPTVQYEALVAKGLMHHNGNGCLTWQSRHTKTKADMNKNERPVKPVRGDIRTIDGIVAEIMALALAMGHEGSVYDEPGKELVVL
ncbi:MAG: terminase TerL endonuclease subunit, partial [Planctomycetota bacterium]